MVRRLTRLAVVASLVSAHCLPPSNGAAAGSPALQAIDPSQAKVDKAVAPSPPPSPNPLGRVNGAPVSGNRQPPTLPAAPYAAPGSYPYPYPAYQYPPGYGYPQGYPYPPPQGYAPAPYPPGYPAGQYAQPYAQPGYPAQGAYPQQQAYPPGSYAPGSYPQSAPAQPTAYPPQSGYPAQQGAYPPQPGYPAQQGTYPAQPGYPAQQGAYPAQPGAYPAQPGAYPAQPGYAGQPAYTQQSGNPLQQPAYPAPTTAYPPQGGYPAPAQSAYPSPGQPQRTTPPTASRPGVPNESIIPDFNNKALPAVPARPPGSPSLPPGGQGWATNVPSAAPSSSDEDRVMKLEQAAFGSTYPEHEVEDRVDHLEKEVLGGKTDGNMNDRISKLEVKLGGAGAFNNTTAPSPSNAGRGVRSDSGQTQVSPIANSDAYNAVKSDAGSVESAAPAQQSEQQPMSAVAQSLASSAVPGQLSHTPITSPLPPIPLPKAATQEKQPTRAAAPNSAKARAAKPAANSATTKSAANSVTTKPAANSVTAKPAANSATAKSAAADSAADNAAVPKFAGNSPEVQSVVDAIPADAKVGDYFGAVKKFEGDTVARWKSFPVTIKLPPESPESWKKNLQAGIADWNRYIPIQTVSGDEKCDIEVRWVNHLLPGILGISRLTTPSKGNIHVEIWLLRPTFYVQDLPEHTVQIAFLHELGHAVGIFGHSNSAEDLMAGSEISHALKGKGTPRSTSIEPRDLNTLKHIYNSPALPSGFMLQQPIEWSFQ